MTGHRLQPHFHRALERMNLQDDAGLVQIAEIVHDIDPRDGRFGRPETPGVELPITGIAHSEPDDERRIIGRGAALFDSLYPVASPSGSAD